MGWYEGLTVLGCLETIEPKPQAFHAPLRFLVQSVVRPTPDRRYYAGFLTSGAVSENDEVMAARSRQVSKIARLITFDGDIERAEVGQAISIELTDPIDIGRGEILVYPDSPRIRRTSLPNGAIGILPNG